MQFHGEMDSKKKMENKQNLFCSVYILGPGIVSNIDLKRRCDTERPHYAILGSGREALFLLLHQEGNRDAVHEETCSQTSSRGTREQRGGKETAATEPLRCYVMP